MTSDSEISKDLQSRFEDQRQRDHTGLLIPSNDEVYVGDSIVLEGRNLPESTPLDLIWHTADGGWGIVGGNEVIGPQFQPLETRIRTVSTDSSGEFSFEFEIPEDYGGDHRLELRTADNQTLASSSINVVPWFELHDSTAALGDTFQVTGYGLGPNMITNNYQITWDNGVVGVMTGTMNKGTATAKVRAVGPAGEHIVQVWRNLDGVPFLQNNTQSPFGPVAGGRQSRWQVTVQPLDSTPEPVQMDPLSKEQPLEQHYPDLSHETEAELSITPSSGQPGTKAFIQGQGFPDDTTVDLVWYTHMGNRVAGIPITPEPIPEHLPTVTTGENGEFRTEVTIPEGLGGTRPIVAEIEEESVAVTGFVMQAQVHAFEPRSGPVGTEIDIKLTGIGWPTYENAYFFVYDNKPLGYVCGVDIEKGEGIIHTQIPATGDSGYHFIDIYPSFFRLEEDQPDFAQKPHLSYFDNHPVRPLPKMSLAFEVTE